VSSIATNWRRIQDEIAAATARAGRDPSDVRVVVAAKTKSVAVIEEAIAAGLTDFGENYVQEAEAKIAAIGKRVRWHMIGHLQRNKAARAAELFDVVHTVHSLAVGQALDRQCAARGRVMPVLIEVNIAGESTKSGVAPEDAAALLAGLNDCAALRVEGLMVMPPAGPSAEAARPYFRQARALLESLRSVAGGGVALRTLSMGMSDDFVVAIEEGATIVRLGRCLLGERTTSDSVERG